MFRKAFTLIELLVVIAIIAILAAILFPVFAQAKLSAKQTQSLSSVKQLGTSNAIYMGDSDDNTVPYVWYNRGDGVFITYMEMLHPYAKNTEIYINPTGSKEQSTYGSPCATTANPVVVSHYIMPMWVRWSFYGWATGATMFAGFPIAPNAITSAPGQPCDPVALAANTNRACVAQQNVENPSATAVIIPGYFISYRRPAPALESNTFFGSACTLGTNFDPGNTSAANVASMNAIMTYRQGGIYGMADTSAKWFASRKMNLDTSRLYNGNPASPYMQVK